RDVRDYEAARPVYEALREEALSLSERAHVAAIGAALGGDYARAGRLYDGIVRQNPRDLLALAVAQAYDLFLANFQGLEARTALAHAAWPEHHAVLAMRAFALEECGHYDEAEALARRALELEPRDLRAHHAVAHVLEMQGRFREGVRWMGERSRWWTGEGGASTHQWWHLALYHVELGQADPALAIFDRRLQGAGVSELIDASALLWRLRLMALPVGDRFAALAERWEPYAEDAHCAFNDMHAMMAFAGAGRWDCAARLLAAQERHIAGAWTSNYAMTRLVGLPACRAIAAYARGEFAAAEAGLRALPPVAHCIGGSHAQRDVLQLTRSAAALRKRSEPLAHAA
ncbi:MAG TPA: tetratricopeptide repeat protein, partial [Burkholderiales bacterium]|nr:tetratricopeptide repeat protein [Burkholderiales bacterium]